jgi:hypothetical protein
VLLAVRSLLDGGEVGAEQIVTQTWVPSGNRIYKWRTWVYGFLCPVDVTITDGEGRRISNLGLNEIPGAEVFLIGDEKHFYLPTGSTYSVSIQAYAAGPWTTASPRQSCLPTFR